MNVPTQALPCNKTTPGEEKSRLSPAALFRVAAVREATLAVDTAAKEEFNNWVSPGYWRGRRHAAKELADRIASLPLPGDPNLEDLLSACDVFRRKEGSDHYGVSLTGHEYVRIKEALRRFRK